MHCDLATDLRLAEHDGRPVAYVRVEWQVETRGGRIHVQGLFTRPDAPAGTLEAILDWAEARSRAVAATLTGDLPVTLGAFLNAETPEHHAVLERPWLSRRSGTSSAWSGPPSTEIPDLPLPPGVEVRPVRPEDLRAIWRGRGRGLQRPLGRQRRATPARISWEEFRDEPLNDLALWQVAWAGDTVVGMVRPYINPPDLELLGVRRGWCENISTHAEWRGRGIAKALIARALAALRDRGMTEAALGVDAENETGALGIYRAMGFVERTRETDFRKPLEPGDPA